jgi:Na+/H+ antiporter NhaD/arsenite permease-like protein
MPYVVLGIVLVTLALMLIRPGNRTEGLYAAAGVIARIAIGPALTTYGSLPTILWLTFPRRHGVEIRTADYLRVSLVVVSVVLLVTTTALAVVLR